MDPHGTIKLEVQKAEIAEAIEPPNLRGDRPPELVKAGQETPDQMKTPMVMVSPRAMTARSPATLSVAI